MQKVKIKLDRNQYMAIYNSMKLIEVNLHKSNLKDKAQQELLQKLFVRMMQKLCALPRQCTLNLSIAEAWAFFEKMPAIMPHLGTYEQLAIQTAINTIHQQTI